MRGKFFIIFFWEGWGRIDFFWRGVWAFFWGEGVGPKIFLEGVQKKWEWEGQFFLVNFFVFMDGGDKKM